MAAMPDHSSDQRRLTKRAQFLHAAKGVRAGRSGFTLQAVSVDEPTPGVGFTVTKKAGNSPERNRIRRRLRAAVRACAGDFSSRHDYVLVGRRDALTIDFATIVADLSSAIRKVHAGQRRPRDPSHE